MFDPCVGQGFAQVEEFASRSSAGIQHLDGRGARPLGQSGICDEMGGILRRLILNRALPPIPTWQIGGNLGLEQCNRFRPRAFGKGNVCGMKALLEGVRVDCYLVDTHRHGRTPIVRLHERHRLFAVLALK